MAKLKERGRKAPPQNVKLFSDLLGAKVKGFSQPVPAFSLRPA